MSNVHYQRRFQETLYSASAQILLQLYLFYVLFNIFTPCFQGPDNCWQYYMFFFIINFNFLILYISRSSILLNLSPGQLYEWSIIVSLLFQLSECTAYYFLFHDWTESLNLIGCCNIIFDDTFKFRVAQTFFSDKSIHFVKCPFDKSCYLLMMFVIHILSVLVVYVFWKHVHKFFTKYFPMSCLFCIWSNLFLLPYIVQHDQRLRFRL